MGNQPAGKKDYVASASDAPRGRVERIVTIGRLVIIPCCLLAFGLDPSGLGVLARIGFALLVVYFLYVLGIWGHAWLGSALTHRWRVADQALDGVVGFLLTALTGGTSSPFFSYLSFPVLFATLRWQWWGALGAGAPIVVAFVTLGSLELRRGAPFETNTFIMRTVYLAGLTGLLCCVGAYERRMRRTMVAVATWNPPSGVDSADMGQLVGSAAAAVGARRAALVWTEGGRPGVDVAFWSGGAVQCWRDDDWAATALVAENLEHCDFLSRHVGETTAPVIWIENGRRHRRHGFLAIPASLRRRFGMRSVIAVRVHGAQVHGRLFLLDMRRVTSDDLVMAGLLARQFEVHLEYRVIARKTAAAAAAEERVLLARNVHDGALQALTGIRLQLEAARHLMSVRPDEAARVLLELEEIVRAEHRTLRQLVTRLQRAESGVSELEDNLADAITALVMRIERQWNIDVKVLRPLVNQEFEAAVPQDVIGEVYQIIREALVNAARHARAKTVKLSVGIENGAVNMTVADDGAGFPFSGRYDMRKLLRDDVGPRVLRDRVAALDGQLTIESSPQGARLEISIPLAASARLSARASSTER